MPATANKRSIIIFLIIWLGEFGSKLGTGLTGFALSVWVFQQTGSATRYALIALFATLPGIVLSPLAGALVDRYSRRLVMILSNLGAGVGTLVLAFLFITDKLELWHIYIITAVSSGLFAFQWPAFSASITLLVPKRHLGRASGLLQFSVATSRIATPLLAAALLAAGGLFTVVLIDVSTFIFAIVTLLCVRIPNPPITADGEDSRGSLLQESRMGWRFIKARGGLLRLLLMMTLANFAVGFVSVLFPPMILAVHSVVTLGSLMTAAGAGMLVGSLVIMAWGGPKRKIYGILGPEVILGCGLSALGLPLPTLALGALLATGIALIAFINGCSQAIWLRKTPPDRQGRVFATRRMVALVSMPISYLIAGPLAEKVFEPLMVSGSDLAQSLTAVFGTGPGRGIGVIFALLGVLVTASGVLGWTSRSVRRLELEIPDALPSDAK